MSSEKNKEQGIPWLLIIFMSIVAMLVTSYITGILITWPKQLVGYTSADANSWLQFWGSMLGGFIGTLAVIYVAHLQNKKQTDLLNQQIKAQQRIENYNTFINEISVYGRKYAEFNDLQHRNLVYIGDLVEENELNNQKINYDAAKRQDNKIDLGKDIYERYSKLSTLHDELSYSFNLLTTYKTILMPKDELYFVKPESVIANTYNKILDKEILPSKKEVEELSNSYSENAEKVFESIKNIQVAAILINSEYFETLLK